jgi:hypothetical protein
MEKPTKTGDPKAIADREKFNSVEKVSVSPLITQRPKTRNKINTPELKSPEEKNPNWVMTPEDRFAERKAAKKVKSDPDTQA